MSNRNIYQRINAVMGEVKYVQKDKHVNTPGHNYKAVTHDQVISVARESLVKNGVVVVPEQLQHEMLIMRDLSKDVKMHLYSADYAIHFVNMDDPAQKISVTINAQAQDNGDKAPGKAVTYATKTAILKVLSLETGEDDESRAEAKNTITETQADELVNTIDGNQRIWLAMMKAFGISHISQLKASKFDEAKSRIEKAIKAEVKRNGSV